MPPKKHKRRQASSSSDSLSASTSSSSGASADSSDFSTSDSSDTGHSLHRADDLLADDDDDHAASYDGARLAFTRKVRQLYDIVCQQSPVYASSLALSAAVDAAAAKISTHISAPDDNSAASLLAGSRTLFPHQLRALQWFRSLFASKCNGILADEMGLGKTMTAATVLADIFRDATNSNSESFPAIIVAPLSTLDTWRSELSHSAASGLRVVIYNGDAAARARILQNNNFDLIITNPDVLVREPHLLSQRAMWSCLVVDEAHRLKNSDSFLHMLLSAAFSFQRKILLTGTPVHNNLKELGSLLHFCNPSIFPTAAAFESLMGGGTDLAAAKAICTPFLLRRTKADINLVLPPKRRVTVMLPLQPLQQHLYAGILRRCAPALAQSSGSFLRNILVSLRKACSHPYLFNGIEPEPFEEGDHLWFASNKLAALACILPKLKAGGHRVLIFSGMTRMLDIVQDFLTIQNYSFERLDGSVRGSERFDALNRFTAPVAPSSSNSPSPAFIFLLSVRAGGQGLNLTQADTCIFLDSDFNPQIDLQAEDRVHRIGQQSPVLVLRFVSQKTVEEGILLSARKKAAIAQQVIGPTNGSNRESLDDEDLGSRALLDAIMVGAQAAIDAQSPSEGSAAPSLWQGAAASVSDAAAMCKDSFDKLFASCDWGRILARADLTQGGDELVSGCSGAAYELEYQPLELGSQSLDTSRLHGGSSSSSSVHARRPPPDSRSKRSKIVQSSEAVSAAAAEKEAAANTRRASKWAAAGYISKRLPPPVEEEECHEDDDIIADSGDTMQGSMSFVVGDVARPSCVSGGTHFILHCVDKCGSWPDRGVFKALSDAHGQQIAEAYELAEKMKDVHLGDAHCVTLSSSSPGSVCRVHSVVLLVCLERQSDGSRRIEMSSFRASVTALRSHCLTLAPAVTCHFHTPMPPPPCPWYAAERVLRSQLLRQLPASTLKVYYYRRGAASTSSLPAMNSAVNRESQTSRIWRAFFSQSDAASAAPKQMPVTSLSQRSVPATSHAPQQRPASAATVAVSSPVAASNGASAPKTVNSIGNLASPPPVVPLFHGLKFGLHQLAWGTASLKEDVISVVTRHGGSVSLNVNESGVTHIICRTATYSNDIATLVERRQGAPGGAIPVVRPSWLYESIAKGQLVSPSLSQHVIFADLHVCLHEVAPVMELDDMRRAFMLRGAVVTALVHSDTDVVVSSLSVWDSFISDAHAAYPKVSAVSRFHLLSYFAHSSPALSLSLPAYTSTYCPCSLWATQSMTQSQLLPLAPFKIPPQQRTIASSSFYGNK